MSSSSYNYTSTVHITSLLSRENMEERSPARPVAMTPSNPSNSMVSYTLDIRPCVSHKGRGVKGEDRNGGRGRGRE